MATSTNRSILELLMIFFSVGVFTTCVIELREDGSLPDFMVSSGGTFSLPGYGILFLGYGLLGWLLWKAGVRRPKRSSKEQI